MNKESGIESTEVYSLYEQGLETRAMCAHDSMPFAID